MGHRHCLRAALLACGLGWTSLASAPAQAASERRYAVVVGNNRGDATDGPLYFAERDAERVADVLRQQGDVREEDVILLRGQDRERVLAVLHEVGRRASLDGEASLVFFYYSGHADSNTLHLDGTQLAFDELTHALAELPAELRVLVVDACRSGGLTRVKGAAPAEPFEITARAELETEGTAIITSSSSGEDAQESDRLRGGVFTHHFVAGLLGAADSSADGQVTLTEAYRYGYTQTLRTTSAQAVVQHPTYSFELRGKDDIVLTRLTEVRRAATLLLPEGGEYLLFEDRRGGDLLAEVTLPDQGRLSLPVGSYLLRRRGSRSVSQIQVRLAEGEVKTVLPGQMRTVPYATSLRKGMREDTPAIVGLSLGAGVEGEPLSELGAGFTGSLGARFELEPLSLVLRGRYASHSSGWWDPLLMQHQVLGADVAAMKLVDVRRVALGMGVRLGADAVQQRFDTWGMAPTRRAVQARAGSLLRAEWAPLPRWVLGAEGGLDAIVYPGTDPRGEEQVLTRVVPSASLDLTWWVR